MIPRTDGTAHDTSGTRIDEPGRAQPQHVRPLDARAEKPGKAEQMIALLANRPHRRDSRR